MRKVATTDCAAKPDDIRYEPEAYRLFQSLTNGVAREVLEQTRKIVLERGTKCEKAYRATETDVREALRRAARRILEEESEGPGEGSD